LIISKIEHKVNIGWPVGKLPMLLFHAEGATPARLQRGLAAAEVYFSLHGLDAGDVWRARIKIEDEDIGVPGIELSRYEEKIWHHWHEAEMVAKAACRVAGNGLLNAYLTWQANAPAKAA
jgi:hypothetical protein